MNNDASIPKSVLVLDIGRTHKKALVFDAQYSLLEQHSCRLEDTADEDGDPCEDLAALECWVRDNLEQILKRTDLQVEAINISAHGAALVHLDKDGRPLTPLYDYMKPLEGDFLQRFYRKFGGRDAFSVQTGSPALGMLNSGLQLYWLRQARPECFARLHRSLHLPQYIHFLLSGILRSDISSVGCHTGMWNFAGRRYHSWLQEEGLLKFLPEPEPYQTCCTAVLQGRERSVGIGMHDSSAALLPYVLTAREPFLLLSTGTWNIALHPFFRGSLQDEDLARDCLYFLLEKHTPVAASRLFLGQEYQYQIQRLEAYFRKAPGSHRQLKPDAGLLERLRKESCERNLFYPQTMQGTGPFPRLTGPEPDLGLLENFETAYHKMMLDLCYLQKRSVELLSYRSPLRQLYVSGGFVQKETFLALLQAYLPEWKIYRAGHKMDSALGAALAIHSCWQSRPISGNLVQVQPYISPLSLDLSRHHPYQHLSQTL